MSNEPVDPVWSLEFRTFEIHLLTRCKGPKFLLGWVRRLRRVAIVGSAVSSSGDRLTTHPSSTEHVQLARLSSMDWLRIGEGLFDWFVLFSTKINPLSSQRRYQNYRPGSPCRFAFVCSSFNHWRLKCAFGWTSARDIGGRVRTREAKIELTVRLMLK